VAVTGPREAGKSELLRATFPGLPSVTLSDPNQRERAESAPGKFLADELPSGGIIEELHRCPALLEYLVQHLEDLEFSGHVVATAPYRLSELVDLQSVDGEQIGFIELLPLSRSELQSAGYDSLSIDEMIFRGMRPDSYSAEWERGWYGRYLENYLERDLHHFVSVRSIAVFEKFLRLCAASCGQVLNLSRIAEQCGVSHHTVRHWLKALEDSYVVFLLPPHPETFERRTTKSPKLYFYDTGLAAYLLGLTEPLLDRDAELRDCLFTSWIISEFLKESANQGVETDRFSYWRDRTGQGVELLFDLGGALVPVMISAAEGFSKKTLRRFGRWVTLADRQALCPCLVYGGDACHFKSGVVVLGWDHLGRIVDWFKRSSTPLSSSAAASSASLSGL